MAQVINATQVKLNDGKIVTAQTGGWYDGKQFWNGTLSDPGQINPQSNQPGAGQLVSKEVNLQSDKAQGLQPGAIEDYLAKQRQQPVTTPGAGVSGASGISGISGGVAGASGTVSMTGGGNANINLIEEQKKAYDASGITDLNQKITDLEAVVNTKKSEADKRRAEVNENPFLSESSRVGRIAKIDKMLNDTLLTDQANLTNLQNQVTTKKTEINDKLGLIIKQYDIDKASRQENFTMFNSLLSAGALVNATAQDLANLSAQTGLPVSFIQSAVKSSLKKDVQIVTETDNAGNVTILTIDKNTGDIVNQASAGNIGKGKEPTQGDTEAAYTEDAITTIRSGVTLKDIFAIYTGVLDPNTIYTLYNANSPYGVAQEDSATLAMYGVKPINTNEIQQIIYKK